MLMVLCEWRLTLLINIGLGNGLVPPLPEPVVTKVFDAMWRL